MAKFFNDERGFVARLPWVTGFKSFRSLSKECTLRSILTGTTCAPITLEEFELYLSFRELSLENLQFVIWFHDYQLRFSKLPEDIQFLSPDPQLFSDYPLSQPIPSTSNPTTPPPKFATGTSSGYSLQEDVIRARLSSPISSNTTRFEGYMPSPPITPEYDAASLTRPEATRIITGSSSATALQPSPASSHLKLLPPPKKGSKRTFPRSQWFNFSTLTSPAKAYPSPVTPPSLDPVRFNPSAQPFREEVLRIVATFMTPGKSKKELPLDETTRNMVVRNLAWSTHPNVFLPVYKNVYDQLEMSAHNFLMLSSANVNLPKQLYWYAVGTLDIIIATVVAVLTIYYKPAFTISSTGSLLQLPWARAWRLFSILPASLGGAQVYSAWRGFCSEVYGRGDTQLKTWELEDPEEVGVKWQRREDFSEAILEEGQTPTTGGASNWIANNKSIIAPFADAEMSPEGSDDGHGQETLRYTSPNSPIRAAAPFGIPTPTHEIVFTRKRNKSASKAYTRPPVFGPEKVVLDPRIRQYHEEVLTDMVWASLWWTIAWTVVIMLVPGPKPDV